VLLTGDKKMHRVLMGKPERDRLQDIGIDLSLCLASGISQWNDIIRLSLKTVWEDVDHIYLARDRGIRRTSVNMMINLRGTAKGREYLHYIRSY
jgi:hypothetical protein